MSEKSKEAIQALAFMHAMTGGEYMSSLFPDPKPHYESICKNCQNNKKGLEHICRSSRKDLYPGTDVVIKSCMSFVKEEKHG